MRRTLPRDGEAFCRFLDVVRCSGLATAVGLISLKSHLFALCVIIANHDVWSITLNSQKHLDGQASSLPHEKALPTGEVFSRRRLPHWYQPGSAHFVTYRLADSIPTQLLRRWRTDRERLIRLSCDLPVPEQAEHRLQAHREFFRHYDDYLDRHCGVRWLADERVAAAIRENLYHRNGSKYQLLSYCIMPTHVHVLLQPFIVGQAASLPHEKTASIVSDEQPDGASPLAAIMHSLKSYTANRANELLERQGIFWQDESYDHWVRDIDELERIVNYIRANAV
jgi:REP element-mobilizing transposase RayT